MKDMKASDRWATHRQAARHLSSIIFDFCTARGLMCDEHDAHGLYFDVWVNGKRFMLDASPEDQPRPVPRGLIVVRDDTHHYANPTRIGSVNMFAAEGAAMMDDLLGTRPV
jgi:hypothetical protein